MPKPKVARADLKPGEILCQHCTAKCCRYFALPIESPKIMKDFEYFRWYLIHGRISIFVDGETWYLMVHNVCDHLQEDNRCGIYQSRPEICREYDTDNCEFGNDGVYDQYFETPEQLWEYAHAVLPAKLRRSHDAPIKLPVLQFS